VRSTKYDFGSGGDVAFDAAAFATTSEAVAVVLLVDAGAMETVARNQ
jgi:hypothetical protein